MSVANTYTLLPPHQWWRAPAEKPAAAGQFAFFSLLLFTVTLLAAPQETFKWLAPLHLPALSVALAVLAYGLRRIADRQPLFIQHRALWLAVALCGWATFT